MPDPATPPPAHGRIVHVSCDFPDSLVPAKTRAIEALVRLVDDRFAQSVVSLNRVGPGLRLLPRALPRFWAPRLRITPSDPEGAVLPLVYEAPGKGLYHHAMLRQLGDWLAEHLARGPRPALIVGHKLSVEALAVARAAALLGVPYALSIQGDSDTWIVGSRPDLRPAYRAAFHGAAMVFPFTPWALERIEAMLGRRAGPSIVLPCAVASDAVRAPTMAGDGLVSVFHLASHKRKNLTLMAEAADLAAAQVPGCRLDVVGGGTPQQVAACEAIVARHPATRLVGKLPLAEVPARINRAAGFVLPSRRESFGLVFIEALFAGTPIAYPAGWAVDGYFDGAPFALRVDNTSAASVAEAMGRMLRDEAAIKGALAAWQTSPDADRFRRATIGDAFARGLAIAAATAAGSTAA